MTDLPAGEAARRQRAMALFDALLDLELPAHERAVWLQRECGNDVQLRQRVEALLAADATADEPFSGNASHWSAALAESHAAGDANALVGHAIGPWRISGVLGHGGMGAVYRAERADGAYRQDAALKLIRVGLDTPGARDRFVQERQILARLQHPRIARLLDGGLSATGAPYFAMELVEGRRIDAWCDARRLDVRQRVELLLQVLDAVGYAHRNLVVHRDLKPSNVLVDGEGEVRLLDFGIAKLLDENSGDPADATRTADRVLTPEYASPEQLHGETITTATDLYQLGVLLYALLAGTHPFGLTSDTPLYKRMSALNHEPESLPHAAAGIADDLAMARHATPKSLSRLLRGDLEAIVGRCLEKQPARRYPSVSSLADDLRAWLQGKPVAARVPSAGYRFLRFARRNRLAVGLMAAVIVSLSAALCVTLWQAQRARQEARRADTVNDYLTHIFASIDPQDGIGAGVTVQQLIDNGVARLDHGELADQPVAQAKLRATLGDSYLALGDYAAATRQFRKTLSLLPRDRSESAFTARLRLIEIRIASGDYQGAEQQLAAAQSLQRAQHPDDADQRNLLLAQRASLSNARGEYAKAAVSWREAWQTSQRIHGANDPRSLSALTDYSDVLNTLGRHDEAAANARLVIASYRRNPHPNPFQLATSLHNLAIYLKAGGKLQDAITAEREALAIRRRILPANHPFLAISLGSLAGMLDAIGENRQALAMHAQAVGILRAQPLPDKDSLAVYSNNWGVACYRAGDMDCAALHIGEALALWQAMLPADHANVLTSRSNLAALQTGRGRLRESEILLREVVSTREQALAREPSREMAVGLSKTRGSLTRNLQYQGRRAEALALARLRWHDVSAASADINEDSVEALSMLAEAETMDGKYDEAMAHVRTSLVQIATLAPGSESEAFARLVLARCLIDVKNARAAESEARKAVALYTGVAGADDRNTAMSRGLLGRALLAQGRRPEARGELDAAIASLMQAQPWLPELADLRRIRGTL